MDVLFLLLFGMLLAGGGTALGIMAHDRARERDVLKTRCRIDE